MALYQPFIGLGAQRVAFPRRNRHTQEYHAPFGVHSRQTIGHNLFTGLVDWWPMCELMTSSGVRMGLHFNWQLGGGMGTTAAGLNASLASASTSAAQNVAAIASNSSLQIGSGVSFSLSCWTKLNASFASGTFMAKDDASTNREFSFRCTSTGQLVFQYGNGSSFAAGGALTIGAGTVTNGVWYHLVGICDFSIPQLQVYVNNVSKGTSTPSVVAGSSAAQFSIAADTRATRPSIDGLIQRCGYWKRALTADEVALLYNGGAGLDYPFIV